MLLEIDEGYQGRQVIVKARFDSNLLQIQYFIISVHLRTFEGYDIHIVCIAWSPNLIYGNPCYMIVNTCGH